MASTSSLKAAAATEDLCDFLNDRLRDRLDMETGYKGDAALQARHLARVLRLYAHDDASGAHMLFAEFHEACLRLCFVGQQRGLEALFRRFDFEGTGRLHIDKFVAAAVARSLPNSASSPPVRVAFNNIRAALTKATGSVYGVAKFLAYLRDSASAAPVEGGAVGAAPTLVVTPTQIRDAWTAFGCKIREQDVGTALSEINVAGRGSVEVDDVALALWGALSRTKRELAIRVWSAVAGTGETAPVEAFVSCLTDDAARNDLGASLSLIASPAPEGSTEGPVVTYRDWLDFSKSVSAGFGGDEGKFSAWVASFGVDTVVARGSVLLAGSMSFGLHETLSSKGVVA